jgi:hypothetical protein
LQLSLADLFQDQIGWQFATEMALFSKMLSQQGRQKKRKSNPVRQSRQLVESTKQENLS